MVGDYNRNGVVDAADYTVWKDSFGETSRLEADGSGNGVVDAADYTIWKDNFGSSTTELLAQSIPEPVGMLWGGCFYTSCFIVARRTIR